MYTSIEIDFDVFKKITNLRSSADCTANDVLRKLLNLDSSKSPSMPVRRRQVTQKPTPRIVWPWVCKGISFPDGTMFRATYRGRQYHAVVKDGALEYGGKKYNSPSAAAHAVTGNSVNGWIFWECKFPGKGHWKLIDKLRK